MCQERTQKEFSLTFFNLLRLFFYIFIHFPGNTSWILMKKLRHTQGILSGCNLLQVDWHWSRLLLLGGGMRSTESNSSFKYHVKIDTYQQEETMNECPEISSGGAKWSCAPRLSCIPSEQNQAHHVFYKSQFYLGLKRQFTQNHPKICSDNSLVFFILFILKNNQ